MFLQGLVLKAFNPQGGIKLAAGYRFTNTDYLDDVSDVYYDWENNGGSNAQIIMSGTRSGHTWNYIGYAVDGNGTSSTAEATPDPTLTGVHLTGLPILTLNLDSNEEIQIMMIVTCFLHYPSIRSSKTPPKAMNY